MKPLEFLLHAKQTTTISISSVIYNHFPGASCLLNKAILCLWQCVTVPKMFNDTDTDTFCQYQIFSIPIPVLFSVPNFSNTGSETFFRYQIFPIPVQRLFSSPKFYWYRFRYHLKKWKIPGTGTHYKSSKFLNFCNKNQFWYQFVPIPVPRLFPVPICSKTGSDTTTKKSRYRYVTLWLYIYIINIIIIIIIIISCHAAIFIITTFLSNMSIQYSIWV